MTQAIGVSASRLGTLIIIIGLPGSGKTTYIKSLAEQDKHVCIYDDYQGESYNNDHDPRLSKHYGLLVSDLKQAKTVVVSDVSYCVPRELNVFLAAVLSASPDVHIELRYFENNPEVCKQNVLMRNRENRVEKELELIQRLSLDYAALTIETLSVHNSKRLHAE